jgi:hypothetical protein
VLRLEGATMDDPFLADCPALASVLALFRSAPLTDIFVEGYVDAGYGVKPAHFGAHRGVRRFAPRWEALYLELGGDALVKLAVDEPSAGVHIARAASFSLAGEIDPDDAPAIASVGDLLMSLDREPMRIGLLEVVVGTPEQTKAGVFRAAAIAFSHRYSIPAERYLFVDPGNVDGIAVGRREEREAWLRAAPGAVVRAWSPGT